MQSFLQRFLYYISGVLFGLIFLGFPQVGNATGELGVLFEDEVEFNNRIGQTAASLSKFHTIGSTPQDSVLFFNLFCEGKASGLGGTEDVTDQVVVETTPTGGVMLFNMTICEFCACAGLEGQAFEDCHAANESCATFNNARFVFDAITSPIINRDPDFPDALRVLFTMTEHDPPINCTGKFAAPCAQGKLKLNHYCTHLFDAMGNIVKSISSAYIFSTVD